MKLVYQELTQLLPALAVTPSKLAEDLANLGHFVSAIDHTPETDVLDLEIRQNRGDCLGYYGLARDLSVLYSLPLTLPATHQLPFSDYNLPIAVTSSDVHRLQALKITGITNSPSPTWLATFLAKHGINSINTLVDLTNYVMLFWGLPNHAFDTRVSTDQLIWENNTRYSELQTLDGTNVKLPPQTLLIANPVKPLSLSFIGGKNCAITLATTEIIIEVAIYNRVRVKTDWRATKTQTEAAIRLDKDLDPETIPLALNHLASLIIKHCGGHTSSQVFNYYPKPITPPTITFDPTKPSHFAGIAIPSTFSLSTLKALGCTVKPEKAQANKLTIIPPSIRKDLELEEDLIEEVLRFWGYHRIPTTKPVSATKLPDITPKILYLIEQLKDQLRSLGYNEIRSWPLVAQPLNRQTAVFTENSINSDYPVLRQSLIQSLQNQQDQYRRLKLVQTKFFEIGKVYFYHQTRYDEKYSLGITNPSPASLQTDLTKLFPGQKMKLVSDPTGQSYSEIILDNQTYPDYYNPQSQPSTAYELTGQLLTLDANVVLNDYADPTKLLESYQTKLGVHLWSLVITDIYKDPKTKTHKYTFRATYFNLNDQEAKTLHLKTFGYGYLVKKTKAKTNLRSF